MNKRYFFEKSDFNLEETERMAVFFDNGDYLTVPKRAIKSVRIVFSDRLIWVQNAIFPTGVGGEIRIKADKFKPSDFWGNSLYNQKDYEDNKKGYLIKRCLNDKIIRFRFFDSNNWSHTVYGSVAASLEGDELVFTFLNHLNEPCAADKSYIYVSDVTKNNVDSVGLDFENCEGFTVYNSHHGKEILSMQINCYKKLAFGGGELVRRIRNGYFLLWLENIDSRKTSLWDDKKKYTLKRLTDRLCYKKELSRHDICNLCIDYEYIGYGEDKTERIEVGEARATEELSDEDDESCIEPEFVGGYSKRLDKNRVLITFGKNAKEMLERLEYEFN